MKTLNTKSENTKSPINESQSKRTLISYIPYVLVLLIAISGFSLVDKDPSTKKEQTNNNLPDTGGGTGQSCSCENGVLENWNFAMHPVYGDLYPSGSGQAFPWEASYGTPQVVPDVGCGDTGYIRFWGHQTNGEVIRESFINIQNGKTYQISICARLSPNGQVNTYGRIGITFTNSMTNTYPPSPGTYNGLIVGGNAPTSPAIAPPGITSTAWTTYTYNWTANSNYNTIYLNPVNDNSGGPETVSWMDVDNICIKEVQTGCQCPNGLLRNWNFATNPVYGDLFPSGPGQAAPWKASYGTPQVVPDVGCCDTGYIRFWGHQTNGEVITQSGFNIQSGKTYKISMCARLSPNGQTNFYGRIGVTFTNSSTNTYPPAPGTYNGLVVGGNAPTTPPIGFPGITTNAWVTYSYNWVANGNYNTIYLNPVNDNSGGPESVSWMDVDNICIQEVQNSCLCINGMLENYNFTLNPVYGDLYPSGPGQAFPWEASYGTPQVVPDSGCCDTGYIRFWGHKTNGEVIRESFMNFQSGHTYKISMCVRLSPNGQINNYGRIGVTFTNSMTNTYPPGPGTYNGLVVGGNAPTTPAIAPPGIMSNAWTTYTYNWTANANYNTIYFNPVNDNSGGPESVSWMDIDNICIQDITPSGPIIIIGLNIEALPLGHVDSIKVYLADPVPPYAMVDSAMVLPNFNNGHIEPACPMPNVFGNGPYYVAIKNRNCLETWSSGYITLGGPGGNMYDFTPDVSHAYGNNMVMANGLASMYSGDVNQDGCIDLGDIIAIFNDANSFSSGYIPTDLTGDDFTDISDLIYAYNNAQQFACVIRP